IIDDPAMEEAIWAVRESGLGATAFVPGKPDALPGWEDSAVPPDKVSPYLRDLRDLFERYGYTGSLYGHFGQGCIHCSITSDLVMSYGGSLSGEHGDGQSRGELLEKMYGPDLVQAFREFKSIWDPDGMMNPGKVVDPNPIVNDLKLGTQYAPKKVETHFAYS